MKTPPRPAIAAVLMAVLVVGCFLYWFYRWPPAAGELAALAAPDAAEAGAVVPASGGVEAEAVFKRIAQDPADKAWCSLIPQASSEGASAAGSSAELQAGEAETESSRQFEAATSELQRIWVTQLRAAGDERSLALSLRLDTSPGARGELLNLARHTADPAVYAWGLQACSLSGECADLTPLQWARLDPGNALPWLFEASNAQQHGDTASLREALYQVGQATRNENYVDAFATRLEALSRVQEAGLRRTAESLLPMELSTAQLSRSIPSFSPITKYCLAGTITDTNRHELCTKVTEVLWSKGTSMIDKAMAVRLAKRIPPPAEVWSDRQISLDAHFQVMGDLHDQDVARMEASARHSVCAAAEIWGARWRQRVQLGEWGQAELALKDLSPDAVSALAQRWRSARATADARASEAMAAQ